MNKLNSVKKAAEEVAVRNAKAVVEYSKETRKIVRDLEKQIDQLKNMVIQQNQTIEELKINIVTLLTGYVNKGTTE